MPYYAIIPATADLELTEHYEQVSHVLREEAYTALTSTYNEPIPAQAAPYVVIEDDILTDAKQSEITTKGGQLFDTAAAYRAWLAAFEPG